jgi:probable HAF family extracellular repeat protein
VDPRQCRQAGRPARRCVERRRRHQRSGQVVESSVVGGTEYAVEWSGGSLIKLEDLPGSTGSVAASLNDAGVVGESAGYAAEWSAGRVINLQGLPGSSLSEAESINDSGQVVGFSVVDGVTYATEWSDGSSIKLGGLPGATFSSAESINNLGQVTRESDGSTVVREPSTWAMMPVGFAGLGFTGYRRAKAAARLVAPNRLALGRKPNHR